MTWPICDKWEFERSNKKSVAVPRLLTSQPAVTARMSTSGADTSASVEVMDVDDAAT